MAAWEQYGIKPGNKVDLGEFDPGDTDGWSKRDALAETAKLETRLAELQEMLYATGKHALLVVLQGMDTSGKDGSIKHVLGAFNPQGCQVTSFKAPTPEELTHDYLWRVHKAAPGRGMVGIFNRSHYEDVLVVRVEELVPEDVWRARYDAINAFEELLAASGVVVAKFYLHISKDEQRLRLMDRLTNPQDQWKFRVSDLKTRAKWDEYMQAYEDALTRCSTARAPWFVIPADKKWRRNLLISQILVAKLEALELAWPPLEAEAMGITIE